MNQHYIHHNAVLPPDSYGAPRSRNPNEEKSSPYMNKDPYANIAMKPNQVSMAMQNDPLQKQPTPAGVLTDLRKSSPTGHNASARAIGGNDSLGRGVANQLMNSIDYGNKPDYASIQKVVPPQQTPYQS